MEKLMLIVNISYWVCYVSFWMGIFFTPFYLIEYWKEGIGRYKEFKDEHGGLPLDASILCAFICVALHFVKIALIKWGM